MLNFRNQNNFARLKWIIFPLNLDSLNSLQGNFHKFAN